MPRICTIGAWTRAAATVRGPEATASVGAVMAVAATVEVALLLLLADVTVVAVAI